MSKKQHKVPLSVQHKKLISTVTAKNPGQKNALRAIASEENHIVLVSGIAGTGKTFISVAWGIDQFLKGKFEKLVFTRPCVEAGEKLGFLPKVITIRNWPLLCNLSLMS